MRYVLLCWIVTTAFTACSTPQAWAQTDATDDKADERQQRLDDALAEYEPAVKNALADLAKEIERQLDLAMDKGDIELAKKCREAGKALTESGTPPAGAFLTNARESTQRKITRAGEKLSAVFDAVAKGFLKDGNLERAEAILNEKAELLAEMKAWKTTKDVKPNRDTGDTASGQKVSPRLEIISATYGTDTIRTDITEAVRSRVRLDSTLIISATGLSGDVGDPVPNVTKKLILRYRYEGSNAITVSRVDYASCLVIAPPPSDIAPDGFTVLAAYYGTGMSWADVTKKVVELGSRPGGLFVTNGGGRLCGVDPAPNLKKCVAVRFLHNGRVFVKEFPDGQDIVLP
jgi:hypothetical protein